MINYIQSGNPFDLLANDLMLMLKSFEKEKFVDPGASLFPGHSPVQPIWVGMRWKCKIYAGLYKLNTKRECKLSH